MRQDVPHAMMAAAARTIDPLDPTKTQKRKKPANAGFSTGRSGVIRTLDPHVPNVVRYQTALHSVTSGARIEHGFGMHKGKILKNLALWRELRARGEKRPVTGLCLTYERLVTQA